MVTGTIFKGLTFDGVDSTQYGVYITGEAVYHAPMRDVEMIEIPGRNGAYALDKGRFTNIEVTYPAGIYGKDESEFAQAISDFRNALCSRKGYCRLTDGYNSNEYRMAVYSSGLEVSPALLKAGQFDITFNCKPQRFLTSGETQSNVTSGATITNPTLFEGHPLLLVDGYGDININDDVISIQQGAVMGRTILNMNSSTRFVPVSNGARYILTLQSTNLNDVSLAGNNIRIGNSRLNVYYVPTNRIIDVDNIVYQSASTVWFLNELTYSYDILQFPIEVGYSDFVRGTAGSENSSARLNFDLITDQGTTSESLLVRADVSYDGNKTFTVMITVTSSSALTPANKGAFVQSLENSYVDSTKSALGQLYIDLDIGECYRIENGQIISINTATILPADLPTLKSGTNTITYDNTFTSFKVTPRWWKV